VEQKMYYSLRVAVALCFIGHGAFGIITKAVWCNYFGVVGIGEQMAYKLMPPLGVFDMLLGVIVLVYPLRLIPAWLVIWGLFTALLRPLSGEPFAEFIERAGNYGSPLALLLLVGNTRLSWKSLMEPIYPPLVSDPVRAKRAVLCLRVTVFLLLLGHGWLNFTGKPGLLIQYQSLGFGNPIALAQAVGIFEMLAAMLVLIRPFAPLLFVLLVWKIVSEIWYPAYPAFEWVERAGSYASILALLISVSSGRLFGKFNQSYQSTSLNQA
ncbi:MAG TPA: DoxX family protein, partial [Flavitalea sp.]|nr:DoxX family protein [Flavitalea sp.]